LGRDQGGGEQMTCIDIRDSQILYDTTEAAADE